MLNLDKLLRPDLETRIILTVVILLGLTIGTVAYLARQLLTADLQALQAKQQLSAAELMAHRIDTALQDQITALQTFSRMLRQNGKLLPPGQIQTLLNNRVLLHSYFNSGLIVMDANGTAIADSPVVPRRIGTYYGDRPHIRRVLENAEPVVSPPVPGRAINAPMMSVSAPILDDEGKALGLVQGVINLSKPNFLNEVSKHGYGQGGGYLIVDRASGLVVAATDKGRIMQPSPAAGTNPTHDRFMAGFEGSGTGVTPAGQAVLASAKNIPTVNWFAVALLPAQEAFAPVARLTRMIFVTASLLVIVSAAAAWWLLRRQLALVRRERDFYGTQMRQSSDGIFLIDPQSRVILDANLQLGEILGYDPAELTGLTLGDVVQVTPEQMQKQLELIRAQKRAQVGERLFKRKDGSILEVEVTASAIRSGDYEVVMINVRDITARKQAERILKESEERYRALSDTLAERVEREVGKRLENERLLAMQQAALIQQSKLAELGGMIGAIAHQWKQPLNTIGLLTQGLPDTLEDGALDAAFIDRHVEKVMDQVRFMSQTIEDFRNFYKPSVNREPFELKRALYSVADLLRTQLAKNNIALDILCDDGILITGLASEFKQVILNLINNARDALEERKIEGGKIVIDVTTEGGTVFIRVRDNAGGIPDELLPERIFEPFLSTKGEKGTGIGLSLGRTIIQDKMGGTLSAKNCSQGAEFTLKIPLSASKGAA